MTDALERFVDAQDPVFETVCAELRAGKKRSHWMWYVFPQIAGLGLSEMSRRYAIADMAEARGFLAHPVLGPRLGDVTAIMAALPGDDAYPVLGATDARKFQSSMTLFLHASDGQALFQTALDKYYQGAEDEMTRRKLGQ